MKRNLFLIVTGCLILAGIFWVSCTTSATQESTNTNTTTITTTALNSQASDAITNIQPKIVRIDLTGPGFTAAGSGFFVDARGYIFTNQHVIDKANSIKVTTMDGSIFNAAVVNSDSNRDIALIKLSTSRNNFPVVTLGNSANVILGQDIIAAGFPLGPDLPGPATFTRGIISALRNLQGLNYIQIDASINPGNSGGCVIDLVGNVLGIVDAEISPALMDAENINLAIPVDEVKSFISNNVGK